MSSVIEEINVKELMEAQCHTWKHIFHYVSSMALKCAVELGIADIIHNNHGEPISLSKLVDNLQINPTKKDGIRRIMRVLVHTGIFALGKSKISENDDQEEEYLITPSSKLLLKNGSAGSAQFLLICVDSVIVNSSLSWSQWFHDNKPCSFESANGMPVWEYLSQQPKLAELLNVAANKDSQLIAKVVASEHKKVFEGLKSIVDVAGGNGIMSRAIAENFPEIRCTVLDLPHVVAGLKGTDNLEFVGGDMFQGIPCADALLLKCVFHDWNDEESIKLLKSCKNAIPNKQKGGKLIIIDTVLEDRKDDQEALEAQLFFDLCTMASSTGKERSEKEWKKIFLAAGFNDYKIICTLGPRSLIEVYP